MWKFGCILVVGAAAYCSNAYGGDRRDILGISPGMSHADAQRVISDHHWTCETRDRGVMIVDDCEVNKPKVERIKISYATASPDHSVFRVEMTGSISVAEASRQFGRTPEINGNGYSIWNLEDGLELGYYDLNSAGQLWLEQPKLSPASLQQQKKQ